ncbi:MAG: alpha-amylase family protein [Bacteroidaceae bacterium]|nr:alpha-amylase family protein [Bacteroidaceae bacterium]
MTIYQVFTRLFGADKANCIPSGTKQQNGCGTMQDFTAKALEQIKALGCTHIWYTGIIEHASKTDYSAYGIPKDNPDVVKGEAGSPYAIRDYYDVDPDLAKDPAKRIHEFELLVERTHKAGLKVIIDFVPNHVARQYHSDAKPCAEVRDLGEDDDRTCSFSANNNFYYLPAEQLHLDNILPKSTYKEFPAKATGNDNFTSWPSKNDWYETVKLNYGIDYVGGRQSHFSPTPDTWHKMLHILLYWASKGIDGFRCDMAEMVPVEFWGWALPQVKKAFPNIIFIAEVYNPSLYRDYIHRGHFDYLYDKVGLYDTLLDVCRGKSTQSITACWQAVDDIRGMMLNFLENHDEQRLASDFLLADARKALPALLVSSLMPCPFMLYFGQELGERGMDAEGFSGKDGRTTIFDYWTIPSIQRWRNKGRFDDKLLTADELSLQKTYRSILQLREQALYLDGGFYDLMYANPHLQRQYAFIRHKGKKMALIVANFSDKEETISLTLPQHFFDFTGIKEKAKTTMHNQLSDSKVNIPFNSSEPLVVTLPANLGIILS